MHTSPHGECRDSTATSTPECIAALVALIGQAEELLLQLTDEQFVATRPEVFGASIGSHLRHLLDHHEAIFAGATSGQVNYDLRRRDPRLEKSREFALELIGVQRERFSLYRQAQLALPVILTGCVEEGGGAIPTVSTLGREIVFCISHAVHHFALIAVLAGLQGVQVSPHFGVAPSTLEHWGQQRKQQVALSA